MNSISSAKLPGSQKIQKPHIKLLDINTMNQIAAGEVVERPASALKELLENSIDAGATRIEINLEEAGRSLISISDNGVGMDQESCLLALQRHATSKITTAADLQQVASFGFRGEALPSIASVSDFTLVSGNLEGERTEIHIEFGQEKSVKTVSGPQGTTITVRDLFEKTPARLKFLKTNTTELSACMDVVSKAAVVKPEITIIVKHGEATLLQTTGSGDFRTVLAEVWGVDQVRALVPVEFDNGVAQIHGFVSPPHFTKPTRAMQWMFVNGRPVRNKTLMAALDQAFRSLTPDRRFPLAFLMISCEQSEIDINVSPTKSEVKFNNERGIFDVVRRGVKHSLLEHGMVPTVEELLTVNQALAELQQPSLNVPASPISFSGNPLPPTESSPDSTSTEPLKPKDAFRQDLRILGQVEDTFIIAENKDNLLIIDQHVAHERILYEMLCHTRGSGEVEKQSLLTPETVHVSKKTATVLEERLDELAQVGFELEPFGGDAFLVRTVPASFRGRKPLEVLQDLIDEMTDGLERGSFTPTRDEVLIMCSCKMAIKAGDKLGFPEMQKLLEDLAESENPYLCPHGRPITIVMPKSDLLKRFKR